MIHLKVSFSNNIQCGPNGIPLLDYDKLSSIDCGYLYITERTRINSA